MRVIPVLFLIALLPVAAAATSVHIEWNVGDPVDAERRYVEHFPSLTVDCDTVSYTHLTLPTILLV